MTKRLPRKKFAAKRAIARKPRRAPGAFPKRPGRPFEKNSLRASREKRRLAAVARRDARVSPRRTHTSATPCRPTPPRRPDASPGPSPDPIPSWSWTMARSTRSSSRVACASSGCTRACSPATSTWYAPLGARRAPTARPGTASSATPRSSVARAKLAERCRMPTARPGTRRGGCGKRRDLLCFFDVLRHRRFFFFAGSSPVRFLALFKRGATGGGARAPRAHLAANISRASHRLRRPHASPLTTRAATETHHGPEP